MGVVPGEETFQEKIGSLLMGSLSGEDALFR
jgi:hypothetical protein